MLFELHEGAGVRILDAIPPRMNTSPVGGQSYSDLGQTVDGTG